MHNSIKASRFVMVVIGTAAAVAVVLAGCAAARVSPQVLAGGRREGPERVVENLYRWYLTADAPYQSSGYLTRDLVRRMDEASASFERYGADPFLCAQDVPADFTVEGIGVSGEEASVVVHQVWNPRSEYELTRDVEVELRLVSGRWKIASIICPVPEGS